MRSSAYNWSLAGLPLIFIDVSSLVLLIFKDSNSIARMNRYPETQSPWGIPRLRGTFLVFIPERVTQANLSVSRSFTDAQKVGPNPNALSALCM